VGVRVVANFRLVEVPSPSGEKQMAGVTDGLSLPVRCNRSPTRLSWRARPVDLEVVPQRLGLWNGTLLIYDTRYGSCLSSQFRGFGLVLKGGVQITTRYHDVSCRIPDAERERPEARSQIA